MRFVSDTVRLTVMICMAGYGFSQPASSPAYDLLLQGGHVIDPKNGISAVRDVAIKDGFIAAVAAHLDPAAALKVVNLAGLYVTPGLVDIHAHVFTGTGERGSYAGDLSLYPDGFTFRVGVTTVADAGCSGWRNFEDFKDRIVDRSKTRVLAFLNIVGNGMRGGKYESDLADMEAAPAAEMALQSRKALLLRLHKGGHDMPPFPHLSESEIRALMGYLKQLAGVPGAERDQESLRVSRIRIGEHIAKSTCHICHAATGTNPNPEQLLQGAIPPLSTLSRRASLSEFVRKVTQGAPVLMGSPPLLCRGRMPVLGYLSEDEAADVYLYLTLHPPESPAIVAAGTSYGGPAVPGKGPNFSRLPRAGDQEDIQPVSLVRFAFFPTVLFLVLGGVVVSCMPLAAKLHSTQGISGDPSNTSDQDEALTAAASVGEKKLFPPLRDPSDRAMCLVLHPPRR